MQWCKWQRWRLAYRSWSQGSKPTSCTDGAGRWIPLVLGLWWLADPRGAAISTTITTSNTLGLAVGDVIVLSLEGEKRREIIYALTETTLTLRPPTWYWRSLAWIRQRWRRPIIA